MKNKLTQCRLAVKVVAIHESNKQEITQVNREIIIQKETVGFPYTVKYFDCWIEDLIDMPEIIINELGNSSDDSDNDKMQRKCVCMNMKPFSGMFPTTWTMIHEFCFHREFRRLD